MSTVKFALCYTSWFVFLSLSLALVSALSLFCSVRLVLSVLCPLGHSLAAATAAVWAPVITVYVSVPEATSENSIPADIRKGVAFE